MFVFIQKIFLTGLVVLSSSITTTPLSCISMNNQACKVGPEIVNVDSNESIFYPFSIKTIKCSGSCNNIDGLYAKMCVPDVVKDLNIKVFNLVSGTSETRHIKWHGICKCKCRLDASVINNKQRWNNDSNCECECDKSYVMLVSIYIIKTASVEKGW